MVQVSWMWSSLQSDRAALISQIKALRGDSKQYQNIVDEKLKEIEPLQQALGKLRTANNAGRGGLCSSEEELNDVIYSLQYRIQHESIPLTEEKQILGEIKQLEGTREKVIANAAMRTKLQDTIGQKEAIQDQVKVMRIYGVPEPYEKLKELTKGREVTKESIRDFIEGLDIPQEAKMNLLKLTPGTYVGAAVELARTVENTVNKIVNGMSG